MLFCTLIVDCNTISFMEIQLNGIATTVMESMEKLRKHNYTGHTILAYVIFRWSQSTKSLQ